MPHYIVVSPEVSETIPVLDDGTGPREYFCCVCSVEAKNKREAKIKAVKHPDMAIYVNDRRSDKLSPFAGLEVIDPVCKHGICICDICRLEECECCINEIDEEGKHE